MNKKEKKLAVIGGGPIGLYLSIMLARGGYKVHLFEKKSWPIDKVCGQGIMPSGHKLLKNLGLNFEKNNSNLIQKIKFIDETYVMEGKFQYFGLGVKRSVLSQKLYELALEEKNIHFFPNSKVNILELKKKNYDYFFCCDGNQSISRNLLEQKKITKVKKRMGARVHVKIKPWFEGVEVNWGKGIEAYVTPVSEDEIELAFIWFQDKYKFKSYESILEKFPYLKEKLQNALFENDFKLTSLNSFQSKSLQFQNVFFLGDAYCFLDGITGEGISLGLKAANFISKNFDSFHFFKKLKLMGMYLNYKLWVKLSLQLSQKVLLRKIVFRLCRPIFNQILKINDINML